MKRVVLLGSTGSIGTSTIKVAEDLPERIRLIGLAAGNNVELLLEPGRVLVGNAGVLLTRVEYLKHGAGRNFAIVDAAMNDLGIEGQEPTDQEIAMLEAEEDKNPSV